MIVVSNNGNTYDDHGNPGLAESSFLVRLTGTDGNEWDLNRGPVALLPGVKLFGTPTVTHWWKSSPLVDGSRWLGMRAEQREITLPIATNGHTWQQWRDIDRDFFRSVDPSGEVTLTVTSPDSVTRTLHARFVTDGDIEDDLDPLLVARKAYTLEFVAAQPFWQGTPITRSFATADPLPWLDPPGPPLYLNPPLVRETSTIRNPGDVPAWPRYTIQGPFTGFRVGVGDAVIESSTSYTGTLTIDSTPRKRTITDQDGENRYAWMDTVDFAPIPPGEQVPVTLHVFGQTPDTQIDVTLTPLYRRPL